MRKNLHEYSGIEKTWKITISQQAPDEQSDYSIENRSKQQIDLIYRMALNYNNVK